MVGMLRHPQASYQAQFFVTAVSPKGGHDCLKHRAPGYNAFALPPNRFAVQGHLNVTRKL